MTAAATPTTTNSSSNDSNSNDSNKKTSKSSNSIFSVSCGATVFMALYIAMAGMNLMKLMYPLSNVDLSQYDTFVHPLWTTTTTTATATATSSNDHDDYPHMHMRIYLSSKDKFDLNFFTSEFAGQERQAEMAAAERANVTSEALENITDRPLPPLESALLWDEDVTHAPSLSRSFLLTSLIGCDDDNDNDNNKNNDCNRIPSHHFAVSWLDQADQQALERGEGGVLAAMNAAGKGIESTSILLTLYQSLAHQMQRALVFVGLTRPLDQETDDKKHDDDDLASILERKTIHLPHDSPIWTKLHSNSTLYVHVLVLRTSSSPPGSSSSLVWPPSTRHEAVHAIRAAAQSNSLLQGKVDMIKYAPPHHFGKPRRILYRDLVYLYNRYVKYSREMPPWVMEYAKPDEHANYERALAMKKNGEPYPYWKPEVAVKFINDLQSYPADLAMSSGMPLAQIAGPGTRGSNSKQQHPTGYAFLPAIHADEIGLTIDKYIPLNETVHSLPLRISFDRSDMEHKSSRSTATEGGLSPARWRLFTHLSQALEQQKALGFEQSDIDDLRRMIADTNLTLLAITMLASALHLLFEFLTFKNEVSFWKNNKDLTGLSVRSLFMDVFGQTIILLFLIEKESSLLMTVPCAIGCLIALWKCQRAAGLQFLPARKDGGGGGVAWYNWLPKLLFNRELRATRLEMAAATAAATPSQPHDNTAASKKDEQSNKRRDLTALTIESDRLATRSLGIALLPLVIGYTLYSLIYEEHAGWISWLVTSASSAVYALGFVMMTPQLFLNWKLKSVAHLPWKVLIYKSLNTFIDDLFSFIIRMPTMARISCFRDDVVFFIYLYQRWLYPVDASRPVEGVGESQETDGSSATKSQNVTEKKNQ